MSDTITETAREQQTWASGFSNAAEMWRWMTAWTGKDIEVEAWPKSDVVGRPALYRGRCLGPAHFERGADQFVMDVSHPGQHPVLHVLALNNVRSVKEWVRTETDGPGIDRDYAL